MDACFTYSNFDLCSCSISKQDCATLHPVPAGWPNPPFNATSCVPYPQWRTGNIDIGVCGWAGAPCVVKSGLTNCNYPAYDFCIDGFCGGGVNDGCLNGNRCLSDIPCGVDGKCGGKDGWVMNGPTINSTQVNLTCITGSAYVDKSDMVRCIKPTHGLNIGLILGAALGGFVAIIIAAGILGYLRHRRNRRPSSSHADQQEDDIPAQAPVQDDKNAPPTPSPSLFPTGLPTRTSKTVSEPELQDELTKLRSALHHSDGTGSPA